MSNEDSKSYVAFAGTSRIAAGSLRDVVLAAHRTPPDKSRPLRIFDDSTGEVVQVDLNGSAEEVLAHLPASDQDADLGGDTASTARGPGRPRLGVVSKEVTLLPRHW